MLRFCHNLAVIPGVGEKVSSMKALEALTRATDELGLR
jgi:hypothetical protein